MAKWGFMLQYFRWPLGNNSSSLVSSCPGGRGRLTDLAAWPHPPGQAVAGEAIGLVDTGAAVVTGVTLALVDVHFAPVT